MNWNIFVALVILFGGIGLFPVVVAFAVRAIQRRERVVQRRLDQ